MWAMVKPSGGSTGLAIPVVVVTKTGSDGNALYRLADPRCKTWNRLGDLKLATCPDATP